jgi:hypothetical protein
MNEQARKREKNRIAQQKYRKTRTHIIFYGPVDITHSLYPGKKLKLHIEDLEQRAGVVRQLQTVADTNHSLGYTRTATGTSPYQIDSFSCGPLVVVSAYRRMLGREVVPGDVGLHVMTMRGTALALVKKAREDEAIVPI